MSVKTSVLGLYTLEGFRPVDRFYQHGFPFYYFCTHTTARSQSEAQGTASPCDRSASTKAHQAGGPSGGWGEVQVHCGLYRVLEALSEEITKHFRPALQSKEER